MNFKFWNAGSGKSEGMVHVVKNAESSAVILAGQPAIFNMNGTDDGLAVVLPTSSTAAKIASFTAGVVVKDIPVGTLQNVQVYGLNRHTKIVRATRAASTNDWASNSSNSFAIGDILVVDSVNNAWIKSGTASNNGNNVCAVVAETMGNFTGATSSANGINPGSATIYYQGIKTFLRFM